jgi:hypothetical protein
MNQIPLRKIVGCLAGAVGILALVLSSLGTAAAATCRSRSAF